jgi:hypothetical protein
MPQLLAQIAPDPQALTQFLIIVGFLGSTVTSWLALRSSNRAQKREVTFTNEYATKAEHAELKNRVDKIADEIVRGFERVDGKRSSSIAGLHDDLESKTTALRMEVKSDIKGVHDRVSDLVGAVNRLVGKVEK